MRAFCPLSLVNGSLSSRLTHPRLLPNFLVRKRLVVQIGPGSAKWSMAKRVWFDRPEIRFQPHWISRSAKSVLLPSRVKIIYFFATFQLHNRLTSDELAEFGHQPAGVGQCYASDSSCRNRVDGQKNQLECFFPPNRTADPLASYQNWFHRFNIENVSFA